MSGPTINILLTLLTLTVCGFAIVRGGQGERITGVTIVAVMVLQRLARVAAPADFHPTISLVGDGLPALVLLVLTVRYASPWLGAIMFFYAAQFALHSFYIVMVRRVDVFHFIVNDINLMGIHLCLVLGTVMAWRRRIRIRVAHAMA